MNQCTDFFSVKDLLQGTGSIDIEYDNRHVPVVAQGVGRLVKYPKFFCHRFGERNVLIFHGIGDLFGVGGVDAVNFRAFQHDIRPNLESPERCTRIRGKERIACATGDEGDSTVLKDLHSIVAVVITDKRFHGSCCKDLCMDSFVFNKLAESQGVYYRRKHTHTVSSDTVETLVESLKATEYVATSVDNSNLETVRFDSIRVWGNLLFLSVIASLVCFVVWNRVMSRIGNVTSTNYVYLNPVFTLIGAVIILGERMTLASGIGSAMILGGVILAGLRQQDNR